MRCTKATSFLGNFHTAAWLTQSFIFAFIGYFFNDTGLLACEPFYSKPSYRILATCSLYFPTTMILMYCYGSSFHASRFRLVTPPPIATTPSSSSGKVNKYCSPTCYTRFQDDIDGTCLISYHREKLHCCNEVRLPRITSTNAMVRHCCEKFVMKLLRSCESDLLWECFWIHT